MSSKNAYIPIRLRNRSEIHMEIQDINTFLKYFEKIRSRTRKVIEYIPKDKLEWSYQEGKFTFGDIIRHLACIERYMYAENAQFKPSRYPGQGTALASGYEATLAFFERMHQESMEIFSNLSPEDLQKKCLTPGGVSITLWKWLRAMLEHEIHHRGQIFIYLNLIDAPVPALYGLTAEEVQARSQAQF